MVISDPRQLSSQTADVWRLNRLNVRVQTKTSLVKTDRKTLFPKKPLDKLMAPHHNRLLNAQPCNQRAVKSAVHNPDDGCSRGRKWYCLWGHKGQQGKWERKREKKSPQRNKKFYILTTISVLSKSSGQLTCVVSPQGPRLPASVLQSTGDWLMQNKDPIKHDKLRYRAHSFTVSNKAVGWFLAQGQGYSPPGRGPPL